MSQCSTGLYFNQEGCRCEATPERGQMEEELALKLLFGEGGRFPYDPDGADSVPKKKTSSQRLVFPMYAARSNETNLN